MGTGERKLMEAVNSTRLIKNLIDMVTIRGITYASL
jgi:hypothetical protein